MQMTNVLIIGEESPGSLYRSYRRGFEELGAVVEGYCPVATLERAFPPARNRISRRLLAGIGTRVLNERVCDELAGARPDLVLVLKGAALSPATVRHLRSVTGAPVVNYYPDDPFTQIRANRPIFGPEVLASYDCCFTFARHLIADYHRLGVRAVEYLPFARDPGMHAPPSEVPDPEFDVVFVGNLDAERIAWLEAAADTRLAIFGEHTRQALSRRSPLHRATFFPGVYAADFVRAIRVGAIAVNVMRRQNARSHNMRSYESPACGAFTMSQRTPELIELFREDEELVCFGSPAELRMQIDRWLAKPPESRESIAEAGFRRVEHDTYTRRAQSIVSVAVGLPSPSRRN